MALRQLASMAHTDDQLYDMGKSMPPDYEPSEYPGGLCFCLCAEDLAKAGGEGGEPGATMPFAAMGEVTAIYKSADSCRIEVQLGEFAGEDGKFFELTSPAYICLCGPDLEKMDLDADCERGDTIHLVGTVRLESTSSSEFGDMATLQITDLSYVEDESQESREG